MRDRLKSGECSKFLKALADPERLRIIECLMGGPRTVGEISRKLEVAIANVSHHLGLMKTAGVVSGRKKGRFVVYTLAPEVIRQGKALKVLDFGCCRLELGEA